MTPQPARAQFVALLRREAIVMARASGVWVAAGFHVACLTVFVAVWGDGMPIHGGGTVFEQMLTLETGLLSLLLPWAAVRCGVPAQGDPLVAIALATGSTPSRLVLVKCLALAAVLTGIAASGLPLLMIARQVPGLALGEAAAAVWPLAALAPFAAALAVFAALALDDRLLGWLVAAGVCVVATQTVPLHGASASAYLAGAAVMTWIAARRVDAPMTPGVLSRFGT
jgi:hypothetical protein